MAKKCNTIGLGKLNKYMLLIFLGIVFNVLILQVGNFSKFFKDTNDHPIIYNLAYSFGLCLSFIIYIRYILSNKRKRELKDNINFSQNNKPKDLSKLSPLLSQDKKILSEKIKILWIFLISIFDFISRVVNCYYWISPDKYFLNWPFSLVIMSLASYFILKMKLYKHHYLSLIIIIILGLVYNIISQKFSYDNITKYYMNYIFTFLTDLIFNVLLLVIYKFLMMKKFIKSFEILFYEGIFESIIGIILLIIATKIRKIDIYFDYYNGLNIKEIFVFISLILCNFATYLIKIIVVDLFSPFYAFLINILALCIFFLIGMKSNQNSLVVSIISMISIIIALIMILVYIEIIELNFCGLSDMTKKNIELRAQIDALIIENKGDPEEDNITDSSGYELSLKDINNRDTYNNRNESMSLELNAINNEADENKP